MQNDCQVTELNNCQFECTLKSALAVVSTRKCSRDRVWWVYQLHFKFNTQASKYLQLACVHHRIWESSLQLSSRRHVMICSEGNSFTNKRRNFCWHFKTVVVYLSVSITGCHAWAMSHWVIMAGAMAAARGCSLVNNYHETREWQCTFWSWRVNIQVCKRSGNVFCERGQTRQSNH